MASNSLPISNLKRNPRLHTQVVDQLGAHIVKDMQPGDTLPNENDLSERLGVSRTVIREATKVLAEKGLVESRPKVGTLVKARKFWQLLDPDVIRWEYALGPRREFMKEITEVRRTIEVAAAEYAALRATPESIQNIESCYEALVNSVNDDELYIVTDLRFHEAIFAACRNQFLENLATTLRVALESSRKITVQLPGSSFEALPLHRAVVDAIAAHDVSQAREAVNKLMDRTERDIDYLLQNNKTTN